jgi:hypothetical protein
MGWYRPVIGRLRKENRKFEASLGYTERPFLEKKKQRTNKKRELAKTPASNARQGRVHGGPPRR